MFVILGYNDWKNDFWKDFLVSLTKNRFYVILMGKRLGFRTFWTQNLKCLFIYFFALYSTVTLTLVSIAAKGLF